MKRKIIIGFALIVLLDALTGAFCEDQYIDVVRLKDGATLQGLIIDQKVGVSLKLATPDGLVYTLENGEIDSVRKRKAAESIPFSFQDVILLRDGVVFRGMIVEQQPETSVVLQIDDDVLLSFGIEEIWKILKEKRVAGMSVEKQERLARAEREGVKLQFQIEVTNSRIREMENTRQSDAGDSEDLQGEIDRLNDEVQDLVSAEQRAEQLIEVERRSEEREEIEALHEAVQSLIDELLEMLDKCEASPQTSSNALKPMLLETTGIQTIAPISLQLRSLKGFANEINQNTAFDSLATEVSSASEANEQVAARMEDSLTGLVDHTLQKLPTQEEIDALAGVQLARVELAELLTSKQWRRVRFQPELQLYVGQLSIEDRLFLNETYKRRDPFLGMALNLVPFLNMGSLVQGDILGALMGYSLYLAGLVLAGEVFLDVPPIVVLSLYAPGYVFGLIEPFLFVRYQNKRLERRLEVDSKSLRVDKTGSRGG